MATEYILEEGEFIGQPISEVSLSYLSRSVRYQDGSPEFRARCRTEIWRREQGRGSATDEMNAGEVNRLLAESRQRS